MFPIPQHVLDNLKCSLCDGYLSVKPLMIRNEDQQICGKCFKLLPTDEKEKCVRQIGLETLSEVLIFPCRYNIWGCSYTSGWCDEKHHETECSYRSQQLSLDNYTPSFLDVFEGNNSESKTVFKAQSEYLNATFQYDIREKSQILVYNLKLIGNTGTKINIKSNTTHEDVEISIQGTVSLQNIPSPVHTAIKLNTSHKDNVYESLSSIVPLRKKCSTCKTEVNEGKYSCLSGHVCCENCKEKMCLACVKSIERQSKKFCKNYKNGCPGIFLFDVIHDHESDCEFNEIKCPVEPCNTIEILSNLKLHLKQDHTVLVNDVTKFFSSKDDNFIIFCYDNIFKCVYFYYKTFVEFFVTYIGSSKEANKYLYEVTVTLDGKQHSKRSVCSNWNNLMLERGITFNREELIEEQYKKLTFNAHIKILQHIPS